MVITGLWLTASMIQVWTPLQQAIEGEHPEAALSFDLFCSLQNAADFVAAEQHVEERAHGSTADVFDRCCLRHTHREFDRMPDVSGTQNLSRQSTVCTSLCAK